MDFQSAQTTIFMGLAGITKINLGGESTTLLHKCRATVAALSS